MSTRQRVQGDPATSMQSSQSAPFDRGESGLSSAGARLETAPDFRIYDTVRGIPAGTGPFPAATVAERGWSVSAGDLSYPVLTVSGPAYAANREAMFGFARSRGALLAPHIKTPMSADIARNLLESGAWGLSVANLQQASVMLKAGMPRIMIANQIGGARVGSDLGRLLLANPDAEVLLFMDSPSSLEAVNRAGEMAERRIPVLIEVGLARAGIRTSEGAREVIDAARRMRGVQLAGVSSYEGAVASEDPDATRTAIDALNALAADVFHRVRAEMPDTRLLLSSGGSQYFDLVTEAFSPLVQADGNADLILRGGAIFFHDHGVYRRALQRMDQRGGFTSDALPASASETFQPAMRVWSEVLSRPEPGLAICGLGMRDVSFDQGFPVPLKVWRDGDCAGEIAEDAHIEKLNDQHGFLRMDEGLDLLVGDLVEFGISHPCTCFDRWRCFFVVDAQNRVTSVHKTFFG